MVWLWCMSNCTFFVSSIYEYMYMPKSVFILLANHSLVPISRVGNTQWVSPPPSIMPYLGLRHGRAEIQRPCIGLHHCIIPCWTSEKGLGRQSILTQCLESYVFNSKSVSYMFWIMFSNQKLCRACFELCFQIKDCVVLYVHHIVLSPMWTFVCFIIAYFTANDLLHSLHG
jgi:hypothetical protein